MKKLMSIAAFFIVLAAFASCDKEEYIGESKLPAVSRDFLKTHFADVAVLSVMKDTDGLDKDYTAWLANGFEVDFTKSGAWDEIDGGVNPLPQSVLDLLPAGISEYVGTNFADRAITKVNKERYGYEIGLDRDTELRFSSNGGFIGYDD